MPDNYSTNIPVFRPVTDTHPLLDMARSLFPNAEFDEKLESSSLPVERWLLHSLLRLLDQPRVAFRLWDGTFVEPETSEYRFTVAILDRLALYQLVANPSVSFGDLYTVGRVEVEGGELREFMEEVYIAFRHVKSQGPGVIKAIWRDQAPRSTSLRNARANIHHHYDLGNEFYRLWLDSEAMQYTCAYYEKPGMTLEQAQIAKLEHVCRKLMLQPGQRVVEAGSGWGGLACYMASKYGVDVTSYNISKEQVQYARRLAKQQGVESKVRFVEDDYRNITGTYDVFVSVGMLEHVGLENYRKLARVIDNCLTDEGVGLLHSIGRNRPARMNGWIEKRIFPGAYPPSITEFLKIFEYGPFSVLDVENLRLHYEATLNHWYERFVAQEKQVEQMYDSAFTRAWRLYLAGSVSAFKVGNLQLYQVVFSRDTNNRIPRNRKHLYRTSNVVSLFQNGRK